MPVKNPKLLQNFQYKGFKVADSVELELDFMEKKWKVEGHLIHMQSGDRIEARVEESSPERLITRLQGFIDQKVN